MSTRLCSRRKRMNSSRSSVVSAPAGPSPASILARRTHSRSAFSPMLRSDAMRRDRAIPDLAEPSSLCFELWCEGTTWALSPIRCFVHETLSLRAFSPIWVSAESVQVGRIQTSLSRIRKTHRLVPAAMSDPAEPCSTAYQSSTRPEIRLSTSQNLGTRRRACANGLMDTSNGYAT